MHALPISMVIDDLHWLEGARREIIPGGSPMNIQRLLVIHFTSGATALSSINYWRSPAAKGRNSQVIIDRDGTIFQCRPFNRTCGHAGVSRWRDPATGKLYTGMNNYSISIELANAGEDPVLARRWSALPLVDMTHRNEKRVRTWEQFPVAQLVACTYVAKALVARYKLDDITGHDCIAPERKIDPGPAFPMQQLREACGFSGLPVVHRL